MRTAHARGRVVILAFAAALAVLVAVGFRHTAPSSHSESPATAMAIYRELQWDELIPKNWNPVQHFMDRNRAKVDDGTLEGEQLRQVMRATWDNAPTVDALDGTAVKLPGYVVPIDEEAGGRLREFLLVPYFGACIHTPPPPANQIVLVTMAAGVKGFHAMDTVWVSGRLSTGRRESPMGISGYRLDAVVVERYVPAQQ